jgi:hypothetical protein
VAQQICYQTAELHRQAAMAYFNQQMEDTSNTLGQMTRDSANFQPPVLMAPNYPAIQPAPYLQPSEATTFQQPVSPLARPLENGPLF